ncbi:nuclear transport factor 2 family protein [Marinobacter hydrocarbonoclasticus]|nr:nuclear transport factor 2 family protein [Marinobacter nauticus]
MHRITHILIRPVAALLALGFGINNALAQEAVTMTQQDKAIALIESLETGDPTPVAYINPDKYIQHNLAVADGLAGFGALLQQLPEGSARADVQRAFTDGDYVVLHTKYDFFGPKAGFDVFRFEDGRIVEHWDNLQEIAPPNASGRTQFDGTTEVVDLNLTDANKALVSDFVHTILMGGKMDQIGRFIDPEDQDYLQHNPGVADGLSGLGTALAALAEQGMPMVYTANHKVLGQGNVVLTISEGTFLNQHVAFYDLFRVANGKIVEHWDTIEAIPPQAQWKNRNGKFGFPE